MKPIVKRVAVSVLLGASLLATGLTTEDAQAQTRRRNFADRPLDTSRRLYVRKSGTKVYSAPAPPRKRVWRYRRADGRVVTKYTNNASIYRRPTATKSKAKTRRR